MPEPRRRRVAAVARSTGQAWLPLVLGAAMALTALAGAFPSAASPHAVAAGRPAPQVHPLVAGATASPGAEVAGVGGPGVAQSSAARPRAATHAMSMDAPIQGGLTAHQEQALSDRLLSAHRSTASASPSEFWTAAMGRTAVARAATWLGMPYSWAGGNASGPTRGRCERGNGDDLDCHVIGFDCSGLAMYGWGPYAALPHLASAQREAGAFHPTLAQLRPGDLVFFSGYLPQGTGHVAIYAGHGHVIEAPQSGSVIRVSTLAAVLADDGVYRGAVRPLTTPTPTLSASAETVSGPGAVVTLRGAHLAGVDTVHLDGVDVSQFVRHTDSAVAFRAPAHAGGTVDVDVSTSWGARSHAVRLTYAQPRAVRSTTSPAAPMSLAPAGSRTSKSASEAPSATPSSPATLSLQPSS